MKKFIILLFCLLSNAAYAERPSNEEPMYGGTHNPTVEQNKQQSASVASLGWQYFYKGDLKTAMKRFNQAWMLDRQNAEAFWGFGLIMGRRAYEENTETNLNESINHLEKATKLTKNNSRIIVDLAFSNTLMGYFLKENNKPSYNVYFEKAEGLFKNAQKLEADYPVLYYNWSVLKFYEENYISALEKLKQAKKFGYKSDPNYENELNEKLKNS